MIRVRRFLPLVAAIVLIGLAVVLALFASDVRAWQGRVTRDDVRFRAQRSRIGDWRTPTVLPGDPARSVLGLDDALAYRRALQLFWLSTVGASTAGQADLAELRVVAEAQLQTLADSAATRQERSTAANLLGVMAVTTSAADSPTQKATVERAKHYFGLAVREDPSSYAARLNLELALRLEKPGKSRLDQDARGGFGFGGANGLGVVGGGY
ncbi:MAG TPA: hypothetical protein VJP41_12605 [Gaiellaceae bacterium]|nr:hypothetical protein [Gaiellaceae bacterium]